MSRTVIVNSGREGVLQTIRVGPHHLQADEPADWGNDAGPNPYELLLAALGACTSMTLRMYAGRKQWLLKGVKVRLGHSRSYVEDCAACDTKEAAVDQIDIELTLTGNLSDGQRQRLMQIADRCPVHRTLLGKIQIRMSLIAPGASTDKQSRQDAQETSA